MIRVSRLSKLDKEIGYCVQHEKQSTKAKDKGYWEGYRQCLENVKKGHYE